MLGWLVALNTGFAQYDLDSKVEGITSVYSEPLRALLKNWKVKKKNLVYPTLQQDQVVNLRCLTTPGNETYIGLEQTMLINASLDKVKSVLDDFDHYKNLFYGFDDVRVLKREQNKYTILWEQHIPFLPNIKYEMTYLMNWLEAGTSYYYLYKLKDAYSIKYSDGFILLEQAPNRKTYYTEFDFFDANWGLLSASKKRIWQESVEGIYLSDVAIKLKAEQPNLTYADILKLAKAKLKNIDLKQIIEQRTPVNIFN